MQGQSGGPKVCYARVTLAGWLELEWVWAGSSCGTLHQGLPGRWLELEWAWAGGFQGALYQGHSGGMAGAGVSMG